MFNSGLCLLSRDLSKGTQPQLPPCRDRHFQVKQTWVQIIFSPRTQLFSVLQFVCSISSVHVYLSFYTVCVYLVSNFSISVFVNLYACLFLCFLSFFLSFFLTSFLSFFLSKRCWKALIKVLLFPFSQLCNQQLYMKATLYFLLTLKTVFVLMNMWALFAFIMKTICTNLLYFVTLVQIISDTKCSFPKYYH